MPTEGWHARSTNGGNRLRCLQHPASTNCSCHCFCPLTEASFLPTFLKYVFQGARSTEQSKIRSSLLEGYSHSPVLVWLTFNPETEVVKVSARSWPHCKWPVLSSFQPQRVSPPPKPYLLRGYLLLPRPTHLKHTKYLLEEASKQKQS